MSKNKRSLWSYSDFGLRTSFGLRVSAFGFLCLCLFAVGCKKSSPAGEEPRTQTTASPSTVDPQTSPVARVHWLGKRRIAAETNATGFMKIWNLPESAKVEAQTLDKLSTAPWRLLKLGTIPSAVTNALTPIGASPLLRPLLDDLVQEECYIEIQQPTNQPSEIILAIKLDETR